MYMRLVDIYGVVKKSWVVGYSGYSYGTPLQYVYQWANPLPYSSQIDEGVYFLRLDIYDWQGTLSFYSEPIRLSILAPVNTIKLVYKHDQNDFDTIFIGSNVLGEFFMRIEGGMKSDGFQPGGKFTMFQDQDYNSIVLQSQPTLIEKFTFGPSVGTANWMGDKINRIFGLSTVTIDGTQYVRNEAAKLERNGEVNYPLAGWTLELIKSDNPYSETFDYHENYPEPLTCDRTDITCDSTVVTSDMTEL